ncbi:hypothetical protein M433DRAFT_58472 [Acidomyces richmondensis BFW]|nr:MAG: hypothetical protein FE78DRAFT_424086 [Acidomyces sp. 'richmondensis']KYG49807.1 hypothetical protein M433DRAFT_58472 [Acidomyces richmondensis BFW]
MFLRQLDLTTALRPSLQDDETLLFVQDGVGLYEGRFKIPNYQNGHAYLTSHRVCYVDNADPRTYSVAVDLKDIERTEFYAGFLKSSPKITLFPKPSKRVSQPIRSPIPRYSSPSDAIVRSTTSSPRPGTQQRIPTPSPASATLNATWVCPICGLANPVPSSFDPSTANQHTLLPPCQACGIKPPLALMIKAAIAAMTNRPAGMQTGIATLPQQSAAPDGSNKYVRMDDLPAVAGVCPRCTFHNHPSLSVCEMCGASLQPAKSNIPNPTADVAQRTESPGPSLKTSIIGDETIETIKFSFRAGGVNVFYERLKGALVQRKWLLQSAPPIPKPINPLLRGDSDPSSPVDAQPRSVTPRAIGIAGLERRAAELRQDNQAVIGTAFEDLEALMTSAKEVIAMAENFARHSGSGSTGNLSTDSARTLLSDSASALGLVTTKDMLGPGTGASTLYITELSRNLAEFLTDDRTGVLRREGGIMSLVDLWAVFNRTRNGIELISPHDFAQAAMKWEELRLPVRLRRFRSGLLVVQERGRTDAKTVAAVLAWLREPQFVSAPDPDDVLGHTFGRGVTAHEAAEHFGWSVGVASEELEIAEESGALCRDQSFGGIRFWENHFLQTFDQPVRKIPM